MDINQLEWPRVVADDALRAATAIDCVLRGKPAKDFSVVGKFLTHMETVKGPLPRHLKERIDACDGIVLQRLQELCLQIHEKALPLCCEGPFSNDEFDELLADSRPIGVELMESAARLVGDMEVDMDAPIEGDVTLNRVMPY